MGLIIEPTLNDLPDEFRPAASRLIPELPDIDLDLDEPGFSVCGYRVLVLPVRPPRKLEGSKIELVPETLANMGTLCTIGRVISLGPLAFDERRGWPEGMKNTIGPGSWVAFHQYSGQEQRVRERDGRGIAVVRFLNDSDIMAIYDNATVAQNFMVVI